MLELLGADTPTMQTISQYHQVEGTKKVDPIIVAALCEIYGIKVSDVVGDELCGLIERARDLLARSR